MQGQAPQAQVVLVAGEQGAYAPDNAGVVHHASAMPPPKVLDTLGAGDTFNAALIDASVRELCLLQMLEAACGLAGQKCGVLGFELGLKAK